MSAIGRQKFAPRQLLHALLYLLYPYSRAISALPPSMVVLCHLANSFWVAVIEFLRHEYVIQHISSTAINMGIAKIFQVLSCLYCVSAIQQHIPVFTFRFCGLTKIWMLPGYDLSTCTFQRSDSENH